MLDQIFPKNFKSVNANRRILKITRIGIELVPLEMLCDKWGNLHVDTKLSSFFYKQS